jgi:hypothetical protein
MYKNLLIYLLFGSFCFACKNDPPSNTPAQRIANAFCECSAQLIQLNQKAEDMRSDTAALNLEELSMEYEKVKECAGIIIGQNGGRLKPDLMNQVNKILLEKCPEVAKQSDLIQEMLAE